jgi:ADP-heptose:LPS heptosyltransferase
MKVILRNHQAPGDILMLTSLVRDWKAKYPEHRIRVKTSTDMLFENNPLIEKVNIVPKAFNTNAVKLDDQKDLSDNGWLNIDVHYGDEEQLGKKVDNPWSIHKCGTHKKHFMYGMFGYVNTLLGLDIKLTELRPDVYLNPEENEKMVQGDYWVVVPGGKPDYLRKIWAKRNWEELFNLLPDTKFVQVGGSEANHIKPVFNNKNVLNFTGHTILRQVLSLIHNAKGVICPITYAMHAASFWPEKKCIVIAGGGEHHTWEAYPGHDFLHTCGTLECCKDGGCWAGKCTNKNPETDEQRCMELITADVVAEIVKGYV